MKLLVGGTKGGTGKSTIAVNLAALRAGQGCDVLLVDTDRQGSAGLWAASRNVAAVSPTITCVAAYGDRVADEINRLAPKFDDVLIDAGGFDSVELRSAMMVADAMLVPARPGVFDFFAIASLDRLIGDARAFNAGLVARLLLNCMPTHKNAADAETMRESVSGLHHIAVLASMIRSRRAFYDAAAEGRGVHEMARPDVKAAGEIASVAQEIWYGH
jgi:chromosome partitioning protein